MDLILWRHAEAHEAGDDLSDMARALTKRGEKQAARMAAWLDKQLPEGTRILCSPALRAEQTAQSLGRKYKLRAELEPSARATDLLTVAGWPDTRIPVLIVGHQPALGQVVAQLMGLSEHDCAFRKGAVWWLRSRQREGHASTVLLAVQSPEFL